MLRHGSQLNPKNPYESLHREFDSEQLEWDDEYRQSLSRRPIEYVDDASQSIVAANDSPDIPFRYSVNPYRGCAHGCAYCYARPSHEYLGFNAGLDFETKIVVKRDAADLFRRFLSRRNWQPEPITFSGVTDCYQPAEREFRLTRQCLEVAWQFRQPVSIVTKNALVIRDIDLLQKLATADLLHVYLSITTLEPELARDMEPRTSIPTARLRAIKELASRGIPVGVMLAPLIPGLTDAEIPAILKKAKEAGATTARYILLRLPSTVEPVFLEWLQRTQPSKYERVLGRIEDTRDGKRNSTQWGERMVGTGVLADHIRNTFLVFCAKNGLKESLPKQRCDLFRNPGSGQLSLF